MHEQITLLVKGYNSLRNLPQLIVGAQTVLGSALMCGIVVTLTQVYLSARDARLKANGSWLGAINALKRAGGEPALKVVDFEV